MYSNEYYLSRALSLAVQAFEDGYSPVGALLVDGNTGEILKEASSQRVPGNTKHAEAQLLDDIPQGLILYTTMEPCIMCMGLATVARISKVFWLTDDKWAGASKVYNYDKSLYVRERLPETKKIECGLNEYADSLWLKYLEGDDKMNLVFDNLPPAYVITNDRHLWLLKGFSYLFNKYWGGDVTIIGFNPPSFKLPDNFSFHSLGNVNKPPGEWSNKLLSLIEMVEDTHFILFLEDFWLNDYADLDCIKLLSDWMKRHPNALRMDLWRERKSKPQARDIAEVRNYRIVETPPHTPYQMSLQVNIWNKELLREVLIPNENPWQVEIEGSKRLAERPDLKVYGTRHSPAKYEPVHQKGKFNTSRMKPEDLEYLRENGCLK